MDPFTQFLMASPTSFHAVENIAAKLASAGFEELQEEERWKLKKGQDYFCVREGSLIAFSLPEKEVEEALILGSHTDSPALKLKPNAGYVKEGMEMLACEVYGAPLLTSWVNRDLGIAGRVIYQSKKGIEEALVNVVNAPVTIPQLAIHLDRKVNEEGLLLNKQEHLNAIAGIAQSKEPQFLNKVLPFQEILAHELFLYPLEEPSFLGTNQELLAAYRLDSLASVFAITEAFLTKRKESHTLYMIAFWDHEEIGSQSSSGASSPFFTHVMERILQDREHYLRLMRRSLLASVDLGQAVNPNFADKHDPLHKPQLGKGVLIKSNAQKRYATDTKSIQKILQAGKKAQVPLEFLASRNDIPAGTTIGPIQAALTGIPTVDMGIGQLSMHSAREIISIQDLQYLIELLRVL